MMGKQTVTLDNEAEEILGRLRELTGLSVSDLLEHSLRAYEEQIEKEARRKPYDIYRELDLGPGGYASVLAREAKPAIRT